MRVRQTRSAMSSAFEAVDEALGHRIVIGIPGAPDRREHVVILKRLRVSSDTYGPPLSEW